MLSAYEQIQKIGFSTIVLVALMLISFNSMLIKTWKEFLEQLGLKSVSTIKNENQDNSIKELDCKVTELDQSVTALSRYDLYLRSAS